MTDASGKTASTVPALTAAAATPATSAPIAATVAPTTVIPAKTVADTKTAAEATDPVFWKRGRLRFHTDLLKALCTFTCFDIFATRAFLTCACIRLFQVTPVLDPLVAFLGETL